MFIPGIRVGLLLRSSRSHPTAFLRSVSKLDHLPLLIVITHRYQHQQQLFDIQYTRSRHEGTSTDAFWSEYRHFLFVPWPIWGRNDSGMDAAVYHRNIVRR